jgi:hypothetical protein
VIGTPGAIAGVLVPVPDAPIGAGGAGSVGDVVVTGPGGAASSALPLDDIPHAETAIAIRSTPSVFTNCIASSTQPWRLDNR